MRRGAIKPQSYPTYCQGGGNDTSLLVFLGAIQARASGSGPLTRQHSKTFPRVNAVQFDAREIRKTFSTSNDRVVQGKIHWVGDFARFYTEKHPELDRFGVMSANTSTKVPGAVV